jgi:hypothetical protein
LGLGVTLMSCTSAAHQRSVDCSVDAGKAFAPEISSETICDRFKRGLGDEGRALRIELRFSQRGTASAKIAQWRDGKWQDLPLFEMAVMDRSFNISDIDRLASDVKQTITDVSDK